MESPATLTLVHFDTQATVPGHGVHPRRPAAPAAPARPRRQDPHLGRRIGRLDLVRKLAEGGMGSVYLAEDTVTGEPAAVKILSPAVACKPTVVQRFFQEARAARAIDHPGVVEVLGADHDSEGNPYLVMEYLEGESLSDRIQREGRLDTAQALGIARQIVSALAAAHALGIVHRDLKPGNIFLCPDPGAPGGERVKLLDFGVAKLTSDPDQTPLTRRGDVIGTPLYMAPEQCRADGDIDHRADLYALGCLVFAMLSGRPPFVGDCPMDVIYAHLLAPVPSIRVLVPDIDPATEALVSALLQKDPAKRLRSAEQVLATLQAPGTTAPEAALHPGPATTWRRTLVIATASVLAALGGAALFMAM